MKYPDIGSFGPDSFYFEEIHPGVWLMDDHRWAYFIWEQSLNRDGVKKQRSLLHLDYHWDGVNDFHSESAQELLQGITDIEEIFGMVSEKQVIKKDSFIAPAIIRRIVNEVHFLCFQDDNTTPGLDEELLAKFNSRQFIHNDLCSLTNLAPKTSLLDIDLDIFNRSDYWETGNLWTDIEILQFLDGCSELIKWSPLITIAMSFGYSGCRDDTRYLTNLVVPQIIDFRRKDFVKAIFPIRF